MFSDEAQQALIAHNAMMMIRFFDRINYLTDPRSIRNLIIDRAVFKDHLKDNILHGLPKESNPIVWID